MARSQAFAPKYNFLGSCVDLDGAAVNAMRDEAREICLSDFTRAVSRHDWDGLKRDLGYSKLLRIETDWHISFARSRYRGRNCVYMTHSSIEYVFTEVTAG